MPARATNRLLVVGPEPGLESYCQSNWAPIMGARHMELLEHGPTRAAWQFETHEGPPLPLLSEISRRWPLLTFLLVYEQEEVFTLGLAKVHNGSVTHYQIHY